MFFDRKSAITAFYYLVASDGVISGEELYKFDELAKQIDPEGFETYRDELIQSCEAQIGSVIDTDDYLDVIIEGIDKAIQKSSATFEVRIPTRLVVWDMLVISYADADYSENERKVIKHVVRLMEIERSVFMEMESMIKTAEAVDRELEWLKTSNRPYNEVRPLIEEIEKRQSNIQKSAQNLIEDEILFMEKEKAAQTPTKFQETKDKVVDRTKEVAGVVGEKSKEAVAFVGSKGKEFAGTVGKQSKKLFENMYSKIRKKED